MWHAVKRKEIIQGSFRKTPKGRDDFEDLAVDGRIILKWTLKI